MFALNLDVFNLRVPAGDSAVDTLIASGLRPSATSNLSITVLDLNQVWLPTARRAIANRQLVSIDEIRGGEEHKGRVRNSFESAGQDT